MQIEEVVHYEINQKNTALNKSDNAAIQNPH
jgi:hypothetical protein